MKTKLLKKIRDQYRTIYDKKQNVYWVMKGSKKRPIGVTMEKKKVNNIILKDLKKIW